MVPPRWADSTADLGKSGYVGTYSLLGSSAGEGGRGKHIGSEQQGVPSSPHSSGLLLLSGAPVRIRQRVWERIPTLMVLARAGNAKQTMPQATMAGSSTSAAAAAALPGRGAPGGTKTPPPAQGRSRGGTAATATPSITIAQPRICSRVNLCQRGVTYL